VNSDRTTRGEDEHWEDENEDEEADEDDEAELSGTSSISVKNRSSPNLTECMSCKWVSCIYAFFEAIPIIEYVDGRKCHTFKCLGKRCKHQAHHYLGGKDALSTGNMQ
jgi:hypothetical protein